MKLTSAHSATSARADFAPRIAFTPTAICFSTPALPPSVTSTLGLRNLMRVTRKAATAKVAAFRKITIGCEPTTSSTAPIAGPTTTTRLSIVDCSALAATRSLSGTSEGTVAPTAGISKTAVAEVRAANSSPSATGPLVSTTTASRHCQRKQRLLVIFSSRKRSDRSTTTPLYGLSSSDGRKRTKPAAPTQVRECVREYTNASSAALYAQPPVAEISRPVKSRRTSLIASTLLYEENQPLRCRFTAVPDS